ncbi:MAG: HAMP domain-containing histidine kinase [Anaerolineales bacterium]|nr:HAMP domain-containing histidine kinase [Anaerolineales bacterium]
MSLKLRLTLLYMSLVGGILILFSVAVYALASLTLAAEIDESLEQIWFELQKVTRISPRGDVELTTLNITFNQNVLVQVWRNGELIGGSTNAGQIDQPLDQLGITTTSPVYRDKYLGDLHLRVLSVPLLVSGRPFATFQIGTNMSVVDGTEKDLLLTLIVASIVAIVFAGVLSWIGTHRALRPLDAVTHTALQITTTNDLSRRIPLVGPADDEVGQLVQSFNQTLGRLEELIDSQRRFVTDVGHELRTPLTVIKGNVDLMRRIGADEEFFDSIESEVDRLTRMVGDLMLLAQAESGKLPMARQMVDLDTVLLEVFRQMKILAKDQIKLKIGDIDQVLICGDRDRLKQVLVNLISNAIKYTPAGGEVIVTLGKVGERGRLIVTDNGPGIPAEDIPHIFERFYRGEKSRLRSKDGKGFGLGLSIAYWIVKGHEGQIEVSSEVGKGTTFCVWLPLTEGECNDLSVIEP